MLNSWSACTADVPKAKRIATSQLAVQTGRRRRNSKYVRLFVTIIWSKSRGWHLAVSNRFYNVVLWYFWSRLYFGINLYLAEHQSDPIVNTWALGFDKICEDLGSLSACFATVHVCSCHWHLCYAEITDLLTYYAFTNLQLYLKTFHNPIIR